MILTKAIKDNNYDNLTSIVIPSGITTIADHAFEDRTDIVSIVIPDTVTDIEKYAFSGCINLEKVYLSANLTAISKDAFTGCLNLSKVYIPISNTVIDERMCTWCPSIVYILEPINNEGEDTETDKIEENRIFNNQDNMVGTSTTIKRTALSRIDSSMCLIDSNIETISYLLIDFAIYGIDIDTVYNSS